MIHLITAIVVSAGYLALALVNKSRYGTHLSPDGEYYTKMSKGEPVPMPYAIRVGIPIVCTTARAYFISTYAHIAMIGGMYYALGVSLGLTMTEAVAAAACLAMSKYHVRLMSYFPILVDAPALAWSLATAVAFIHDQMVIGIICMYIAAMVSEKSPVFAAIWSGSIIPLFGLVLTLVVWTTVIIDSDKQGRDWLDDPYNAAKRNIKAMWARSPWQFITPFGIGLVGLFTGAPLAYLGVAVALLPVIRSMDYGRLATWAYPLLLIEAVKIMPVMFLPLAPLVHQYISETEY